MAPIVQNAKRNAFSASLTSVRKAGKAKFIVDQNAKNTIINTTTSSKAILVLNSNRLRYLSTFSFKLIVATKQYLRTVVLNNYEP